MWAKGDRQIYVSAVKRKLTFRNEVNNSIICKEYKDKNLEDGSAANVFAEPAGGSEFRSTSKAGREGKHLQS